MKEKIAKFMFLIAALASICCVLLICGFLFANSFSAFNKIGLFKFIGGAVWKPPADKYGIFPMILGSIYTTAGAVVIGVPIGILTAVFLAFYCPKRIYKVMKSAAMLMAGIPSIVYGFFGMVVIAPLVRNMLGGTGNSLFTASLVLGIMLLPTLINVTEAALIAVPKNYYEGALALGSTHERALFAVIIPAAKSGIMAGVILGIGRAIGETMAVIMIAGNQPVMPGGLLKGVRTLTANIAIEMGYADGLHREALIATAAVLFVFILIINVLFTVIKNRKGKR